MPKIIQEIIFGSLFSNNLPGRIISEYTILRGIPYGVVKFVVITNYNIRNQVHNVIRNNRT